MMKIICTENEFEAGKRAAKIMADLIKKRPKAVIGLATGSTPIGMYGELAELCRSGDISFKNVKTVNLDEYIGLPPTHRQSYAEFMRRHLFSHVDVNPENAHIPSGISEDPCAECERYNRLLDRLGRVDIQLLGIGHNGHIAFNEPSDCFTKDTGAVALTDSTVEANSRFFSSTDEVPKYAISMGIGRILRSKRILLLVMGKGKADILEKALFGKITPTVPASILQFYQGELTVVGDKAALKVIIEKHPEHVTLDKPLI